MGSSQEIPALPVSVFCGTRKLTRPPLGQPAPVNSEPSALSPQFWGDFVQESVVKLRAGGGGRKSSLDPRMKQVGLRCVAWGFFQVGFKSPFLSHADPPFEIEWRARQKSRWGLSWDLHRSLFGVSLPAVKRKVLLVGI